MTVHLNSIVEKWSEVKEAETTEQIIGFHDRAYCFFR